jgi:DNA modification methylase
MTPERIGPHASLYHGDCRDVLPRLPDGCVDLVLTDPPYPEVDREYGRWTEAEWFALMDPVVNECRRVLKPSGSAVFVLQPTFERIGRLRTWLWEFLAKWGREWGVVQDAWWWNPVCIPQACTIAGQLLRPSLKACVWLGNHDCYRDQGAVLWAESESNAIRRTTARAGQSYSASGHHMDRKAMTAKAVERGGVTPFNVLPITNTDSNTSAAARGHPAGTPIDLCRFWVRYACPPGGVVLDGFAGSGTVGEAALTEGRRAILVEKHKPYVDAVRRRIRGVTPSLILA